MKRRRREGKEVARGAVNDIRLGGIKEKVMGGKEVVT